MPQIDIEASKDLSLRTGVPWGEGQKEGAGLRERLLLGKSQGKVYRALIDFGGISDAIGDISVIEKAELVVTTSEDLIDVERDTDCFVYRLTEEFEEGTHSSYAEADWVKAKVNTERRWRITLSPVNGGEGRADITSLFGMWLPTDKRYLDGTVTKSGGGKGRHGILIRAEDESTQEEAGEIHSIESGSGINKAYIVITYSAPHEPDVPGLIEPRGEVLPGTDFSGTYYDQDLDPPKAIRIWVRKKNSEDVIWDHREPFSATWPEAGGVWTWTVPHPGSAVLKGKAVYEWRAKAEDDTGLSSEWSDWVEFQQLGTFPTVTPVEYGTRQTLGNVPLRAAWTTGSGSRVDSYIIELRPRLSSDSLNWDDPFFLPLWRLVVSPPSEHEQDNDSIERVYDGPSLPAGEYSVRYQVFNDYGVASDWAYDHTVKTTRTTVGDDEQTLTWLDKRTGLVRIVLRDIDTSSTVKGERRRPGDIVAIIDDASNIGVSEYVNEPGELYFTIPADHPQAGECEPFLRHYEVQQYRGGEWRLLHEGMLVDFDADQDQVVVYGYDYLGMLSLSLDSRFPEDVEDFENEHAEGGAKYVDEYISAIIRDQLKTARDDLDSPVGFINIGNIDPLDSAGERAKVTIYSAFVQRLEFIKGLIQSHRRGLGIKTRLSMWRNPASVKGKGHEWRLDENPGTTRDNLRLEFGSLVQGFRIIPMGDFASRAHGVGREPYATKPWYFRYPVVGSPLPLSEDFGSISKANVWEDVIDRNDLKRRVQQMYSEYSAIGKRVALGLKVHGLGFRDGYTLCDDVPLDIDSGIVNTNAWGTGYWTIWGHEYRVYPDGHDELTLVLRPKESLVPQVPDIADSDPIPRDPSTDVGCGPPPPELAPVAKYLDMCGGVIWCYDWTGEYTGTIGFYECGITSRDTRIWGLDLFQHGGPEYGTCTLFGGVTITPWAFRAASDEDEYVRTEGGWSDVAVENPLLQKVRDSADAWYVHWTDPRSSGECGLLDEYFGVDHQEIWWELDHNDTTGHNICGIGPFVFTLSDPSGICEDEPLTGYVNFVGGYNPEIGHGDPTAPDKPRYADTLDWGWGIGGQHAEEGYKEFGLGGSFVGATETWIGAAPGWASTPAVDPGWCYDDGWPRMTGAGGSGEVTVTMVIDPLADPPIVPLIYEWVVTSDPWAGEPFTQFVWSEKGETIEPPGQYPPWSYPISWDIPDVPSGNRTGRDEDGQNVHTNPGEEQVFGMDDEHGDAPWREEHTMAVKFKWPGTTPVLPPAHLGFRWYGLYGYAEAYVKFGDPEYPMGVLAKGPEEDFTVATIDPEVWHIFQMRIANNKVYARVFVEGAPVPPWMASTLYDATQTHDPARIELVVGSVAEEGVFDINDPMADAIDIKWVGAGLEPLSGQDIEDETVGEGNGIDNEYEVASPFEKGSLDVYIDGAYVTPIVIDEDAGTFILDAPPSPGALIVVDYTKA